VTLKYTFLGLSPSHDATTVRFEQAAGS